MKSTPSPRFPLTNKSKRLFLLTLVSLVAVAALLSFAVSANRASRAAKARAEQSANAKSAINPLVQDKQPNAPNAAVIVATLSDNTAAATKVAPGGTINYTATITNNGVASPADDATNLNFSAPLDANTTLVAGSVHASPLAFNDTYNWVGNTQLDTVARALPVVTANDVAVNAPGGTDTFTLTAIGGGATALGGVVTLASPSGSFVYTPPVGRPNLADGATVQDSFTYTITNSADPTLTGTGTVRINLTGRVWYLQAGAAGDGRSNTPSSSPAAMSTAADKATDIFYIFSNAGSLNGPFSVDAGQQLLGQGVNLVVSAITLFNAAAPTPTTTNTGAGNCVTLAGAPGNNTLSGFNIGNCTALAIAGSHVGTLAINNLSINTTGGGLDLTGVATPAVNIVLGGLTATGGTVGANLVGMNGTINLASGTLSGASGAEFTVSGGAATVTYTGAITQNNAQRVVNVQGTTGGSVTLSGTITGGASSLGVHIGDTSTANGNVSFTTLNLGTIGARMTNQAVTITNGSSGATYTLGTITIFTNNAAALVASNFDGTLNCSSASTINSTNSTAMNIDGPAGLTTLGMTLVSVAASGGTNGMLMQDTNGSFTINGTSTTNGTGGTIQNTTGRGASFINAAGITLKNMTYTNAGTSDLDADNSGLSTGDNLATNAAIHLVTVTTATLDNVDITGGAEQGINGNTVSAFSLLNSTITNVGNAADEDNIHFFNMSGTSAITNTTLTHTSGGGDDNLNLQTQSGTLNLTISSGSAVGVGGGVNQLGSGYLFGIRGTSNATITFSNASSTTNFSGGIVADSFDTAIMNLIVTNSTSSGNNDQLSVSAGDNSNVNLTVTGNTLSAPAAGDFLPISLTGSALDNGFVFDASITGNTITVGNGLASDGIVVNNAGGGAMNVLINNNTFDYSGSQRGILLQTGTDGAGAVNATITDNDMDIKLDGANNAVNGILAQSAITSPTGNGASLCADIGGAGAASNTFTHSLGGVLVGGDIRVRQRNNGTVRLAGYLGAAGDTAAVVAYLNGRNVEVSSSTATADSTGFAGGAACTQPSLAPDTISSVGTESAPGEIGAPGAPAALVVPTVQESATVSASNPFAHVATAPTGYRFLIGAFMHRAVGGLISFARELDSAITPTANAQDSKRPNAPSAGEIVSLNAVATLPATKSITIKYSATVNTTALTARQATTQGTITANGGAISVQTDDPDVGGTQATITQLDTTLTWTGDTSTDWNDAANWDRPVAVQSSYAPGVSNPAVNDVAIPNVGVQPTIGTTDIGIYSLNISNGRTLTITNPRILTIGGSPGGDLTLDGIISGGFLNLGTGTHAINNAGGTGSLSSTNVATVLSGGIVTLNNNLQAGALAVNAGGSMNITNRILSLNGSGGALVVPGGATFTTTGSTVAFNGTAAQQAAGVAYNNLTINNTIGLNVTGVTLTGNATVNGVLALTSSDLATGAFTLTQPNTTASTGVSDVVGIVSRTSITPFALAAPLTFGNPNNVLTITAGATRPTAVNVNLAKTAPPNPNGYAAAVLRTYTISKTGGAGFTSTLRLHYLDAELNGNAEALLNLRFERISNLHWSPALPSVVDQVNNWVESNAVSDTNLTTRWTFSSLAPTASNGVVTGRIVDDNGAPVEGAVVRLEGTQNRKFITDANGFYRFDNVETNGFYTVTPSRANYSFTPSVRSFSQIGESTEAAFGATLTTSTLANPLDTPEYFVRQHYVDFLNREPDEAGFNFWSDQIIECGAEQGCIERRRENVSAAYFLSIEFQRTGGLVDGVYRAAYGARPDFAHFLPDTRAVGLGVQVGKEGWEALLATNAEAFVNSFVNRPEFHAAYDNLSNADYVDTLISHTGVSFTSAERDALLSGLGAGSMTRAQALRSIAENNSFVSAKFNETFVMMEYFGYLRRDADASGFAFWLNKLNEFNGNFEQAEMVKAFIVSGEYRDRFPR